MVEFPLSDAPGDQQNALLDATLRLVSRWGVTKTSMTDIAREAGVSRATVYRVFPRGKQHLFGALARRELADAVDEVRAAFHHGQDLADAITRSLVVAARHLDDHPAARRVLDEEPELVLPYLGFGRIEIVHRLAITAFAPTAATRVTRERAPWLVEWMVRVFISYVTAPEPALDLTNIDRTRSLVERFVLPAFAADQLDERVPA